MAELVIDRKKQIRQAAQNMFRSKGYGASKGSKGNFGWGSVQYDNGAGKSAASAGHYAGPGFDGTFDPSDEKLNQLSAKQRKQVVRSRSILLQVNGPSYQPPKHQSNARAHWTDAS